MSPAVTAPARHALAAFARKDFAGWRGLPSRCPLRDVLSIFPPQDSWVGSTKLGSDRMAVKFRFVRAPRWETPLRVCVRRGNVVLIEAMSPELNVASLTGSVGTCEFARLDAWMGVVLVPRSEWICAGRGLAFQTDSAGERVLRLGVFAATSLEEYTRTLRTCGPERPLRVDEEEWISP